MTMKMLAVGVLQMMPEVQVCNILARDSAQGRDFQSSVSDCCCTDMAAKNVFHLYFEFLPGQLL